MLSKRPKIIIYSLQSLEEHFHHFLELFPFQVKTMIDHKPKWSISALLRAVIITVPLDVIPLKGFWPYTPSTSARELPLGSVTD